MCRMLRLTLCEGTRSRLQWFPLRGLMLFLMVSGMAVVCTSIWRLHEYPSHGAITAYALADLTRISSSAENAGSSGNISVAADSLEPQELQDGDVGAVLRQELNNFRAENDRILKEILQRIQYLADTDSAGREERTALKGVGYAAHHGDPDHAVPGDVAVGRNSSEYYYNSTLAHLLHAEQNLTEHFWNQSWRSVLDLDPDAKTYLERFEATCQIHDSPGNVSLTRGGKLDPDLPSAGLCPCVPATLIGRRAPDTQLLRSLTWEDTHVVAKTVSIGGHWKPHDCVARRRLAVIVPCRDREQQLRAFLAHIHPLLQRQLLEYRIFVVEQVWPVIYNKASSMNAGFLKVQELYNFDCVLFHDVDLLAEDDRSIVYCGRRPLHYGAHLDKWGYRVGYARLFGGAVSLTKAQFTKSNGYSNMFYGWGGEDDDFDKRVRAAGFEIGRPPQAVSRHTSLSHKRDLTNPVNPARRRGFYNTPQEYSKEGLSTVKFDTTDVLLEPLYTWIRIKLRPDNKDDSAQGPKPFSYMTIRGRCRRNAAGPGQEQVEVLSRMSLSLVSCRYQCDNQPSCRAFLYEEYQEEHCVILDRLCPVDPTARTARLYVKSGNVSDTNYKMVPGDCHGKDIVGLAVSLDQCIRECDARPSCLGFVFGLALGKSCWLKNEICKEAAPSVIGVRFYTKIIASPLSASTPNPAPPIDKTHS